MPLLPRRIFAKFMEMFWMFANVSDGSPDSVLETSVSKIVPIGVVIEIDIEALKTLVESDPRQDLRDMATKLNTSHETVRTHLQKLGKVLKEGVWLPHKLSSDNLQRLIVS